MWSIHNAWELVVKPAHIAGGKSYSLIVGCTSHYLITSKDFPNIRDISRAAETARYPLSQLKLTSNAQHRDYTMNVRSPSSLEFNFWNPLYYVYEEDLFYETRLYAPTTGQSRKWMSPPRDEILNVTEGWSFTQILIFLGIIHPSQPAEIDVTCKVDIDITLLGLEVPPITRISHCYYMTFL